MPSLPLWERLGRGLRPLPPDGELMPHPPGLKIRRSTTFGMEIRDCDCRPCVAHREAQAAEQAAATDQTTQP